MSIINIVIEKPEFIKRVSDDLFIVNGDSFNLFSDVLRKSLDLMNKVTHVWFFKIKQASSESHLSDAEKEKATFYKGVERERYSFCRGLLRTLLGYYLQLEPLKIRLNEGASGKPFLSSSTGLSFNLSHSDELVIYTFSNYEKVGVDVEHIRDLFNVDRVAMNLLPLSNFHKFTSFPPDRKKMLFFEMWTAREACFKALGGKLADYSINLDESHDTMDFKIKRGGVELSSAKIIHFKICDDYLMALTIQTL